jgi:hypothetical protein
MRSKVVVFVILAVVAGTAGAAGSTRALYRIELRDGSAVLARDLPRQRGSVVLFHLNSSGALTSLPEEQVVRVRTGAADKSVVYRNADRSVLYRSANRNVVDSMVVAKKGMQPGDVVFLGPTGGGSSSTSSAASVGTAATLPGGVYDPRNPAYGGYSAPRGSNVVGVSADTFPSVEPPTAENPIGSNGFPTTPTGAINPPGATGSTPLMIGPNGTPVMSPAGAPGSVAPPIGPNGTPVLAQPGTPGATSPPVGSNGYPAPRGPGR